MKLKIVSVCLLLLAACQRDPDFWSDYALKDTKGQKAHVQLKEDSKGVVLFFLLPDCPFAQFYTMAINQVYGIYASRGYRFYGVVPGNLYTMEEVDSFKSQYNFVPEILVDDHSVLTRKMKVTVVPDVIFTDRNGKILYSGKVDDQAVHIGQKKFRPSRFYLLDALKSHSQSRPIQINKTEPQGCYIE